jgi:hypothetical protein
MHHVAIYHDALKSNFVHVLYSTISALGLPLPDGFL